MLLKRLSLAALAVGAGLSLGGCADTYGYGGGVGYASGYGYGDRYYDGGYGYGDGYGYADLYGGLGYPSYFGWYNDFYYPGTGIYVYDRYRRPFRWNNDQRRHWEGRRNTNRGDRNGFRNNWNGFAPRRGQALGNSYPGARNGYGREPGSGYRAPTGDAHRRGDYRSATPPGSVTQGYRSPDIAPNAANAGGRSRGGGNRGGGRGGRVRR